MGGGFETHFCNFPAWRHHPTECPATVPQCTVTHCDGKMQNIREWSRAGLGWAGLGLVTTLWDLTLGLGPRSWAIQSFD